MSPNLLLLLIQDYDAILARKSHTGHAVLSRAARRKRTPVMRSWTPIIAMLFSCLVLFDYIKINDSSILTMFKFILTMNFSNLEND